MKTNFIRATKSLLSLLLAFAMIAGALFVANTGVNINAGAETVNATNYDDWTGQQATGFASGRGSQADPYIIATAEQLAYAALSTTLDSAGMYFKVAPNSVFNMNGMTKITLDSTATDVKNADKNSKYNWNGYQSAFKGNFDGNGVIIYNIYSSDAYTALFPRISTDGQIESDTFENVTIKASYFDAEYYGGAIVGYASTFSPKQYNLYFNNCSVINCYFNEQKTGKILGTIAGKIDHNGASINNCLTSGNIINSTGITGGFIAQAASSATLSVKDSISIGTLPYPTGTDVSNKLTTSSSYTNVYTDQTVDSAYTGITKLTTDKMTGVSAKDNMDLLWDFDWVTTSSYPVPNLLDTSYAWNGTEAEFTEGDGSAEKPYIIENAEQLFKMVRSTGLDAEGNTIYYKVKDGVTALYLNPVKEIDQSTFEKAVKNSSVIKNWSDGLRTDTQRCPDTEICGGNHKYNAYSYTFSGKFDGNGVTIYGLYSKTTGGAYWAPGTGFVPGLAGYGTIANVTFDKSYVYNDSGYASVITSSDGYYAAQYEDNFCPNIGCARSGKNNPAIMNVAVRNAYVGTTSYNSEGKAAFVSGFVANNLAPGAIKIYHCLFDGTNSKLESTATTTYAGGLYSTTQIWENVLTISDSISLGFDIAKSYNLSTSDTDKIATTATIENVYTNFESSIFSGTVTNNYTTVSGMPMLNWAVWDVKAVSTYGTPMPKAAANAELKTGKYYKDAFKNEYWYNNSPQGHHAINTGYKQGIFSDYQSLVGGGTESDPYIISDDLTLFKIIASGGVNRGIPQYYKLACDIDIDGAQWVKTATDENAQYNVVYYEYVPFAGIIDGDGHTITGMATTSSEDNAGFIPQLNGGTVKNLHFRDCYAYTNANDGKYGIIVGNGSGTIIGCSVANCENAKIVGNSGATIKNSYITVSDGTTTYYLENSTGAPTIDGETWYQGGDEKSKPMLVNRADAMPYADIDGDGEGYGYTISDAVALQNRLLKKSAFNNVYGDINHDGKINIRDMVILRRVMVNNSDNTKIWEALDGFWFNLKAGKFKIHYTDTDNYDFARKLELYFAEVADVTVNKHMTEGDNSFDIVLKKDKSLGENKFKVAYDLENAVLTFSGDSFTAVEQAVLNFIEQSDPLTNYVYTRENGEVDPYKYPVPINGKNYYYVWGDEFDSTTTTTVSYGKWLIRNKMTDTDDTSNANYHKSQFAYLYPADDSVAPTLNVVSGGNLTLHRGIKVTGDSYTEHDPQKYGYRASGISTKNSMLFKRGYAEISAKLPADGFAFPSWWMLSFTGGSKNNMEIERSLYGKVYKENPYYDKINLPVAFSADDVTSFKYQLPINTLEIDAFEVIQKPSYNISSLKASNNYNIYFNIHKWYTDASVIDGTNVDVYELDWNKITDSNKTFEKIASGTKSNINANSGRLSVHADNLANGQLNAAINEFGDSKYLTTNNNMMYKVTSADKDDYYNKFHTYGFLWDNDSIDFYIDDNAISTVTLEDMNYGGTGYDMEQYVYMLLDNHFYTSAKRNSSSYATKSDIPDATMEIEYVRLYQAEGNRDIVTAETEAFNSNDRWSAPIYN